ncbi:hypothetical protein FOL47_005284 [Perkinsus chesapeaki]|uniref:Uncharacterized protein n=1 Tax=Perkinsus chesapeaki TaxID=330153 RepID=A0A7J6LXV4_PERCH|nr:hypothetical protein FOL47_005284 [Perkinsus chesapeaki]
MSYVFRATAELHNAGKLSMGDRTLAVRLACSGDTLALTAMATLIASARSFDEQANQLSMYLSGVQQASSSMALPHGPWSPSNMGGPQCYYRQQSPPGQAYRTIEMHSAYPQPHYQQPQPAAGLGNTSYQSRRSPALQNFSSMPPSANSSGGAGVVISPSSEENGRQPSPALSPSASPVGPSLHMTGFCGNLSNDGVPQLWEPRARRLSPDEYPPLVLEPMRSCSPSPTPPLPGTSPQGTPSPVLYPPNTVPSGFDVIGPSTVRPPSSTDAITDDSENDDDDDDPKA